MKPLLALHIGVAAALLGAAHPACALGKDTRLAWWPEGDPSPTLLPANAGPPQTPLGSVWKLFVYSYLAETGATEAPYRCEAGPARAKDEEYCCEPGDSIDRDTALARSCSPYFAPQRLNITADDWSKFWAKHWNPQPPPDWLDKLAQVGPATTVPVAQLLTALRQVPAHARQSARQALMAVAVRDERALAALGSGPRYKTWSWTVNGQRQGGAAGWLLDGTPFWLASSGTSARVLPREAADIAQALPQPTAPDATAFSAQPCVDVHFFSRYPIQQVFQGKTPAAPGAMNGRYRVLFRKGNSVLVDATPPLQLRAGPNGPEIDARLALENYVARVVDREGQAQHPEAARALAVAARSYVLQNATEADGCRRINDDSRTQRVSPNPPSSDARDAAAFTDGLVLTGSPIRYHTERAAPNVMAWQAAVQADEAGQHFVDILRAAYATASFTSVSAASSDADCRPMPQASTWLAQRAPRWQRLLRTEVGYQPPPQAPQVCELQLGAPHADQRRNLIRIREFQSREGRVTLIHEYLHLAFRFHPKGQDEAFVEQWAQRLADL